MTTDTQAACDLMRAVAKEIENGGKKNPQEIQQLQILISLYQGSHSARARLDIVRKLREIASREESR